MVARACIVSKVVRCGELMRQVQDVEMQIAVVGASHGNADLHARRVEAIVSLRIDLPKGMSIIPAVTWVELI